jgi:hypothetical protein
VLPLFLSKVKRVHLHNLEPRPLYEAFIRFLKTTRDNLIYLTKKIIVHTPELIHLVVEELYYHLYDISSELAGRMWLFMTTKGKQTMSLWTE